MLHALMADDEACQWRALDAGVLRITSGAQTPKRGEVERLLRRCKKKPRPKKSAADELAAVARADDAAAALLAEETAEAAAAKLAAQTKRKPKKKKKKAQRSGAAAGAAAGDATAEDAASSSAQPAGSADSSSAADAPQPVLEHNTPRMSRSGTAEVQQPAHAQPLAAGVAPAAHAEELPLAALAPPYMPLPLAQDVQQQTAMMPPSPAQDAPHMLPSPTALPPRAPPPYQPPSGAPPVASSSDAPSIFVAVDALAAAQLAAQAGRAAGGLVDATSECNRLLNAVVNALFHVHCFRAQLMQRPLTAAHDAAAPLQRSAALVDALRELFLALRAGCTLRDDDASDDPAEHTVAPTALRLALVALSGGDAGMSAAADAAEVLTHVYDALQILNNGGAFGSMFDTHVLEQARCTSCSMVTHARRSSSFFHIVLASALCTAHASAPPGGSRAFEALLARLQARFNPCDQAAGGCGARAPVAHVLERAPTVFTLSLAWDTAQPSEAVVAATMAALGTALRPELFYFGGEERDADAARMYDLRALVCRWLRQPLHVLRAHGRAGGVRPAACARMDAFRRRRRYRRQRRLGSRVQCVRARAPAAERALLRARAHRLLSCQRSRRRHVHADGAGCACTTTKLLAAHRIASRCFPEGAR
jgi:hypothetical protein